MTKIHALLFFIFVFYSCTISTSKDQVDYKKDLSQFPRFLIDHFPSNISTPYAISKNVDITSHCIYYQLYLFNINSVNMNRKYIGCYGSDDSLLIAIKRNTLFEWGYVDKKYYESLRKKQLIYYPVIYFEEMNLLEDMRQKQIFSSKSESGLGRDFNIYVYESKPGLYWKGLKPLDYMPKGWRNGYSKGICINDKAKVIVYWFVVW